MVDYKYNCNLMERKNSRALPVIASQTDGAPVWTEWNLEMVARQGYKKNTVCYGAVSDLASSAASVPFILKDERGRVLDKHPLLDLLNRPNPYQGKNEFWEAVYAFRWLMGNTYVEGADKAGNPNPSRIEELYCLPAQHMKVVPGRIGIQKYQFQYAGRNVYYPVNPVNGQSAIMHWKSFNPTNIWYGMSPLEAAGIALDIFNKANVWNRSLLDNGARPSGAVTFKDDEGGMLTDEQFERLEAQVQEKYGGSSAAGKILLLEGGLYWTQMSMSPHDMDFLNSRNTTARDVAAALQYPSMLLGIPGDNTYSNQKEARQAVWEDTIIPSMVEPLCSHLTRWLEPYFGKGLTITYDENAISALQPRRDAIWKRAEKAEWVTVNEKREMTGFPPKPGGDVILVKTGTVPMNVAASQTEMPKQVNGIKLMKGIIPEMSVKAGEDEDKRELEAQLKLQDQLISIYQPELFKVLDAEAEEVADAYKRAGKNAAYDFLNENAVKMEELLSKMYMSTMDVTGSRVFSGAKHFPAAYESKAAEESFEAYASLWTEQHAAELATTITETSKTIVREVIVDGIAARASNDQIAKAIREKLGMQGAKYRADRIARTETHKAYNVASQGAMEATGLKFRKKWVASDDERTRTTHAKADFNNGIIEQNESFQVGGSKLRFPGDPQGAAKEIINCRCGIRHIPVYDEGEE